jgi:hypothetical protein
VGCAVYSPAVLGLRDGAHESSDSARSRNEDGTMRQDLPS